MPELLNDLLDRLTSAPARVRAVVANVDESGWRAPIAGDWTRWHVLAHLVTNDLRALTRVRVALGEATREELEAVNQTDVWNQRQVDARVGAAPDALLAEMESNRRELVRLLESIPEERRADFVIEGRTGPMSLADYLALVDGHDGEHIAELMA